MFSFLVLSPPAPPQPLPDPDPNGVRCGPGSGYPLQLLDRYLGGNESLLAHV